MAMSSGHDQGVGLRVDLQRREHVLDRADQDALGGWESVAIGVLMAVVHDPDVEIRLSGQVGDGLADVSRTDDHQANSRPGRQKGDTTVHLRPGSIAQ